MVEPNAAAVGAMVEASFARLRALMAVFSEEMAAFRPMGRWDLSVIFETQGTWCGVQTVRKNQNPNKDERQSCHRVSCERTHLKRTGFAAVTFKDA